MPTNPWLEPVLPIIPDYDDEDEYDDD